MGKSLQGKELDGALLKDQMWLMCQNIYERFLETNHLYDSNLAKLKKKRDCMKKARYIMGLNGEAKLYHC